jgi:hypothetical protein
MNHLQVWEAERVSERGDEAWLRYADRAEKALGMAPESMDGWVLEACLTAYNGKLAVAKVVQFARGAASPERLVDAVDRAVQAAKKSPGMAPSA